MVLRLLLPLLLVLLLPLDLQAWGREGHRLIAEIAERRLNQKALAAVAALLGPGETLQSVSAWADEVRPDRKETTTWHYINIPLTAPKADYRTYCPATGCVAGIIGEMESRLRNPSLSKKERYEALKFLVHFVGDLHQPLHCGDRGDRGDRTVESLDQRRAAMAQVLRLERDFALTLPLAFEPEITALSRRVRNYIPNLAGRPRFEQVWLAA